ncbi:hypothetical protein C8J36_11031 [Rhizobium sp. PP-F2F-G48]|nr:hypothetical protein C8J36_11031 [Rhizobium sp. PP-F2F-G48]
MQSHNCFSLGWFSAELVFTSADKPLLQSVQIDVENENPVKLINKLMEIPGAAAEEGDRVAPIGDQGFYFVGIPKVVLVAKGHIQNKPLMLRTIQRFTRFWIASIGQLAVAMDYVVTAPLQFGGD